VLVYRTATRRESTRGALATLRARLSAASEPDPGADPRVAHERWISTLIDGGVLEAALVDAHSPEHDRCDAYTATLRALVEALAGGALDAWCGCVPDDASIASANAALDRVEAAPHPEQIETSVPEGYAYYGLYPETYADAAARFHAEWHPERVVVIGLRSIGTSLSAVVAAQLRRLGATVLSFTVRPHGHPFARELRIDQSFARAIGHHPDAHVAVVDEGPGLSGSSFASVSRALESLGIPPERVTLFPSWDPDGASLGNEDAGARWPLHRRYVGSFEDLWLRTGRLAQAFGGARSELRDLSGGRWRALAFADESHHPAVHPQHERRKFLMERDGDRPPLRLEFVGLAHLGRPRADLAERLGRAGYVPECIAFSSGFLASTSVGGRPMTADDRSPGFLDHAARYLAHRGRTECATADVGVDALVEAVRINVAESLGDVALDARTAVERCRPVLDASAPVRIDGRLAPHEWLVTREGWMKTDAVQHHDDHFLPGCQDIAWDVAGFIEEWELAADERSAFIGAYRERSGDESIACRLPVWRVAYLAHRTGYATLAASSLGESADGMRMQRLATRCRDRLDRAVADLQQLEPWQAA
jgi:hypothetical protein